MFDFSFWLRKTFPGTTGTRKRTAPKKDSRSFTLEQLEDRVVPAGGQGSSVNFSFAASDIQTAYQIAPLLGVGENGKGITIALVDAYDDPYLLGTASPQFKNSDLHAFDLAMGLPDPPSFVKYGQINDSINYTTDFTTPGVPGLDPLLQWEPEEALDVEWAHAIAPQANIVLVEADNFDAPDSRFPNGTLDWQRSVDFAATPLTNVGGVFHGAGANVVSMSFGYAGGFLGEGALDPVFDPLAYPGVTFLASSGDTGAFNPNTLGDGNGLGATGQASYPADSVNVVAVGGTSLTVAGVAPTPYAWASETAWNDGYEDAGGGGISNFEPVPAYQQSAAAPFNAAFNIDQRTAPDVSFNADPISGVAIYDTFEGGLVGPIGGTSVAAPSWAGLVAIADQIRVENGASPLASATQTLPILYDIYNSPSYSHDFHDITAGGGDANFVPLPPTGPGYDLATGIGTPIANFMVPDLANVTQMLYESPPNTTTNNYVLKEDPATHNLDLTDNGVLVAYQPVSVTSSIDIGGGGTFTNPTDNSLTIDYSGGVFNIPITFDGGQGTGPNVLTVENSTVTNAIYTYSGPNSGTISMDGRKITFIDTTRLTDDNTNTNETFNLLPAAQGIFEDDTDTNYLTGISEFTSLNGGFPTTTFSSPSHLFTVNAAGGSGLVQQGNLQFTSLIQLSAMDPLFDPPQETFVGQTTDVFQIMSEAAIASNTNVKLTTATLDLKGLNPTINALNGNATSTITTSVTGSSGVITLTVGASGGSGTYSGTFEFTLGQFSLRKDGSGTETLTGQSSFTGLTTVIDGTLADGVANALPTATALTVTISFGPGGTPLVGTFDLNGFSQQVASVVGTGTVTNSSKTLAVFTVANPAADTFVGSLTGNLALTKINNGTLTLTTANTYTGVTTINAGTIADGIANALPIGTSLIVSGSGTLDLAGFNQQVASVTGNGTVTDSAAPATFTINNLAADAFAGTMTAAVILVKTGGGTLTLSGASTYSGSTTISAGAIVDDIANALPTETALTVSGGAKLDLAGFNQQVGSVVGTGTVTDSGAAATFTVDDSTADVFAGSLTGALSLAKSNSGTLTLSTANSYSGSTTVSAGTLADGIANALTTGTSLSVTGSGTLDLAGFNQQVASVTGNGTVTDSGAAATFTINNAAADTFAGTMTAAVILVKTGGGTLTLSGASTYSGPTTISAGAIADAIANALPIGTVLNVTAGTKLDLAGFNQQVGSVTGTGTVTDSGAPATFTVNDSAVDVFSGKLTGALSLAKTNSGTLALTNANTYSGTTSVSAGTLEVDGSIASAVAISGTGTLSGIGTTGAVTATAGTLAPGKGGPGVLTTGALNLQSGSALSVLIGGNTAGVYSQDKVASGTVTLGTGVVLNLATSSYIPLLDDDYIILNNLGGSAVSGTFVAGAGIDLPAGTVLTDGTVLSTNFLGSGLTATLSYSAGPAHDSIGIKITPTLTISISPPTQPITAGGPIFYTITYADSVSFNSTLGFGDITLNTTKTATGTVFLSGGGSTYTVEIIDISGDGTLAISIDAGTATDGFGGVAPAAGPSTTFIVDNTAPTVTISTPSQPITAKGPVSYTVTFADANFGTSSLTTLDVHLVSPPLSTATGTLGFVQTMPGVWTVTISSISGDGPLGISIDQGAASDLASNQSPAASSTTFIVDNTPPTISISGPSPTITAKGAVSYTVIFADANFGTSSLTTSDVHLVSPPLSTATGTLGFAQTMPGVWTVTISSISGDGALGISIDQGAASDLASNPSPAASSSTVIVDNTAPTISISGPLPTITANGPVKYMVTFADANFSTSSLTTSDVHLVSPPLSTATGTLGFVQTMPGVWTVTVSNTSGDGALGISIDAGAASDLANNQSPAASSNTFIVDNTAPTVAISGPSQTITGTSSVSYTVTFSDTNYKTSSLTTSDVHLVNTGGNATGMLSFVQTMPGVWTVTISSISGDGPLGISIDQGAASDLAGNQSPASGNSATFTVDNTAPTVAIGAPTQTITATSSVSFTVTYTDANFKSSSLTTSDVHLVNTGGNATGTLSFTQTMPNVWMVTISSISGNGPLGISIDAGSAVDQVGNLAAGASSTTFTVDNLAPTVAVSGPSQPITATSSVSYTVTFSDTNYKTSSLTTSDVHLVNTGGNATGMLSFVQTMPGVWTVTISSISGDGPLGISIDQGAASDLAGNQSPASGNSATFTVDNTAPTVGISGPSQKITATSSVSFTVTYTDANFKSSNLTTSNVHLVNTGGNATGMLSFDNTTGATRTVTISNITGNGPLGISIDAGSAVDLAGNLAASASSTTFTVDNTAPTVSISGPTLPITTTGPVSFTVKYNDANFGSSTLTTSNVHLVNTGGNATGTISFDNSTGATRTVTISNITGDGPLGISIDAGSAVDQVGNQAPASGNSATFIVDNTTPLVSISAPSQQLTATKSVSYTVTYSDTNFKSSSLTTSNVHLVNPAGNATGTLSIANPMPGVWTVTISNISGDGTLGISIDAGSAVDTAGNLAAAASSATFTVDNTPPAVIIGNPSNSITGHGSISYSVFYSDPDFGSSSLTANAVTLYKTGTATGTVSVSGSHQSYVVTISSITGTGALDISIAAGTAVDVVGNVAQGSGYSTPFNVENTPPTLTISPPMLGNTLNTLGITPPPVTLTSAGPIVYTLNYGSAFFQSSTLSTADVQLVATGTATGTLSFDSNSGSTRTVTVSNITGNGTLGIAVAAGSGVDQVGNPAPAASSQTFMVDNIGPTVTVSAPSVKSTVSGSVKFTVTYLDPNLNANSISLSPANITLDTINPNQFANITVTGTGASRTVTISGITGGKGAMGISINPGTAFDRAGNAAQGSNASPTFNVTGAPRLTISTSVATSVLQGSALVYKYKITNLGTQASAMVMLQQTPSPSVSFSFANNPGWSSNGGNALVYNVGALAAGASTTITFIATVSSSAPLNSTLTDAISVLDSIGVEASMTAKTTVVKQTGRRNI